VDPRSAPEPVLGGHLVDQVSALCIDARSARTPLPTAPPSMEPIAMPTVDRGRLNQHERVSPARPHPTQDQPQQTVSAAKAPIRPSENAQLVAQSKNLEQQVSTRLQGDSDCRDRSDDTTHRA